MQERTLTADYVIVGAGAVAMAFADTLLSCSDASVIIVDRRHKPGGHWNDAYPFVKLHGPSAEYGVDSRPLGSGRIDETGLNRGLLELATGPEICAYFDQVMRQHFLPSGRVAYMPLSEYADGVVTSLMNGTRTRVEARKKIVDATFADTRVPATHAPAFAVSAGARCIPPNALVNLRGPCAGFVLVGGGKTAMDAALWLLEHGADPRSITWIRPRESWLINRKTVQPSYDFFTDTIGAFAIELEAAQAAQSVDDLFVRLETAGLMRRIDPTIRPAMFRCAIVSEAELGELRRIEHVVRMGRVQALEADRIILDEGVIPTSPRHVHVNCSADGIPRKPPQPIFQERRIVLQYMRRCSPCFSGALAARIETMLAGDADKNALAATTPAPDEPIDWLRMQIDDARNRYAWSQAPELQAWLGESRLNAFAGMIARAVQEQRPDYMAIVERYRAAIRPGIARMSELLSEAA